MFDTLVIAGSVAAIVAAIIGASALIRSIFRDRPLLIIEVFGKVAEDSKGKYYQGSVRVADRSNRLPNMDIGPQFDLLGGDAIPIPRNSEMPHRLTYPKKNAVQYDVNASIIKAAARRKQGITFTGTVSARTFEQVWYTAKVPRSVLKELTK